MASRASCRCVGQNNGGKSGEIGMFCCALYKVHESKWRFLAKYKSESCALLGAWVKTRQLPWQKVYYNATALLGRICRKVV